MESVLDPSILYCHVAFSPVLIPGSGDVPGSVAAKQGSSSFPSLLGIRHYAPAPFHMKAVQGIGLVRLYQPYDSQL
jgi:hypothetical protein